MQEIIIKTIFEKQPKSGKGEPFYVITAEDGAEFTSFDAKLKSLGAGTKLNIEPKIKGRYINIEKWEVIGGPQPGLMPSLPHSGKLANLHVISNFFIDNVPMPESVIGKYQRAVEDALDDYIHTYIEKKPVELKNPVETKASVQPGIEKFKNIGQVLTKAVKLDPPVQPNEITQVLGKELKEITDYDAAWEKAQEISREKKERGV